MNGDQFEKSLPYLEKAHSLVIAYEKKEAKASDVVTAVRAWKAAMGSTEPIHPDMETICKSVKENYSLIGRVTDVLDKFADLVNKARVK